MKPRKNRFFLSATSALLLAPAAFAQNQNGTWNVTTTPGSWATPGNWVGNTVADGSGFTANFNTLNTTADATTVTLDGARTIGNLIFGDTIVSSAASWTLANGSGGSLVLAGTTPTITVNALGTNKNAEITATLGGTSGFTKDGAGTLLLNNVANSISGAIVLSAGTLQLNSASLSNATTLAINGGTLVVATTTANAIGADNNAKISFGGGTLQYNVNTPSTDYSARFSTTANQQYRINVISVSGTPRVVTFSSDLASAGGTLAKTGPGTLILAAANTFTGATTVTAGTLQLNSASALQNSAINAATTGGSITGTATAGIILNGVTTPTFGGLTGDKALASLFNTSIGNYGSIENLTLNPGTDSSYSYSGVIANGAANMKLTKTGAGTQTLTGPNTYTGATTVSAGTLTLGASGVIADSSVVNLNAGTLNTTDGVVESLHSIQATAGTLLLGNTNAAGSADITLLNNSVLHNINVGLNGTLRLAADKTLTQTATGTTGQLAAGDTFTLNIGSGALAHLSGAINSGGADGAVIKTGAGTLRVTASNSQWGGNTLIDNGILEFNTIANYNVASSLGDGDNGLDLAGTNDAIIRIGSAATAATLKMIEAQAANSSNRAFQLGDAGGTIEVVESTQTLTLSGIVSNAVTSGALTKTGAGRLVLSGPNTYTGGTIMNAGTLNYGNASALSNGPITFTGGSILQAGVATTLANDIIVNENVVGTVGTAGFATTLSGAITGAGTLVKGGGGVLTLTGGLENTISGGFQVNTGRLVVNDGLSLTNTGPVTVLSGASLNYSKNFTANNLTNNITLSGSGDGTFGALNLWGGADATGTITLAADATISHDFNAATISGSITGTNRNLTLRTLTTTVAQPGMVVSAPISLGTGSLTVTGVANTGGFSIRLTGNNSYSGGTTVTAGTLQVNNTTGSGTGSGTVTVNSGAILGGTGNIAGNIAATGSIAPGTTGIGTLKVGGDVTWNGGSIWNFDLSSSGSASDKLDITGNLAKGSAGTYQFDFMDSTPAWGETFTLATFASTTFSLSDFDLAGSIATLGAGSYGASSFTLNSTSLQFTAVPEPTSALAGVLLAAGLLRRRRR